MELETVGQDSLRVLAIGLRNWVRDPTGRNPVLEFVVEVVASIVRKPLVECSMGVVRLAL